MLIVNTQGRCVQPDRYLQECIERIYRHDRRVFIPPSLFTDFALFLDPGGLPLCFTKPRGIFDG